jgi:hypothetical protein
LDVSGRLHFEMTEILIAGQRATLDGLFQGASRPSRKHGQRVTHWNTRELGPTTITACRIHVQSLHYSARNWDAPAEVEQPKVVLSPQYYVGVDLD